MISANDQQKAVFPYTDLGNAKRWCSLFREHYKWIFELKQWYRWNGSLWEPDIAGTYLQRVDDVLDNIQGDLKLFGELKNTKQISDDDYEKYVKRNIAWHNESQSSGKIHSMLRLASSRQGMSRSYSDFDSKGKYLGVKNGVINLRTKELVTGKPEYFLTKSCGTKYHPEATCPKWLEFLNQIFDGSEDKIQFIQRLFGQGLLGTADKDKLIIMCGSGANGKSTLTDTMITLLGDYALNTSARTIMQSRSNKDYYLADLKGVRLSIINESSKNAYLDEELVKSLVDSGEVQARQIYQAPFTFQPVATPVLTTNYRPRITGDYSISRRILFVPFDYQVPKDKRNPKFKDEILVPELSGILNWALEGCSQYLRQGLNPPKCIIEATNEYIRENDKIGRFIEERMVEDPGSRTPLQEVKNVYVEWAIANGFREVSTDRVSTELRSRDWRVEKRNNGVYYVLGLRFRTGKDTSNDLLQLVPGGI